MFLNTLYFKGVNRHYIVIPFLYLDLFLIFVLSPFFYLDLFFNFVLFPFNISICI